jgi:hypothetical protein
MRGKAGAGKSTMMKFVYLETKKVSKKSSMAVASFFFNARGDYLERSISGCTGLCCCSSCTTHLLVRPALSAQGALYGALSLQLSRNPNRLQISVYIHPRVNQAAPLQPD